VIKKYLNTKVLLTPLFRKEKRAMSFAYRYLSVVLVFVIMLFNSCKKESDIFPEHVTIIFMVNDDLGVRINGAKIYIFDSYQAYLNGVNNNTTSAIDSGLSASAGAIFKLEAKKDYWVLATYYDATRLLKLSNVGSSAQLDKFTKGSVINATIFIGPNNANVSFWSDNTNIFPIAVHFNGQVDSLYNPLGSAPAAPNNTNAINHSMSVGKYPYYAVGKNGCVWAGSLNLSNGSFTPVQFNTCNSGIVHFYTPQTTHATMFPGTVVLDVFDNAGTINGPTSIFTCTSGPNSNVLSVSRPAGTYNYVVRTADSACTFTGTFTITPNSCQVIQLPICP
jgi:hypothetical protein